LGHLFNRRVQFGQFSLNQPSLLIKETQNQPYELIDSWLFAATLETTLEKLT
jgi:hypothetical protein